LLLQPIEPSHRVARCGPARPLLFSAQRRYDRLAHPNRGHFAGVDRWYTIDLKPDASAFTAVVSPNLGEHHGIVMDWRAAV